MKKLLDVLCWVGFCLLSITISESLAEATVHNCKINSDLEAKLKSTDEFDIIIELPSHREHVMDYPLVKEMDDKFCARGELIEKYLREYADKDQKPFIEFLQENGESHSTQPLWIVNRIAVTGVKSDMIRKLAKISSKVPCEIREQFTIKAHQGSYSYNSTYTANYTYGNGSQEAQWGVKKIGAPLVWPRTRGRGVVVANIDSGVRLDHEALRDNFAGDWLDAVDGTITPTDFNGHGTHVMGIICGNKHGTGVAPEATWKACRALDEDGNGNEVTSMRCAQFIFQQRPDVVCNSWGSGQGLDWFNEATANWKAVGIIAIWSIGNDGPNCRTAGYPGDQENNWSVGNTNIDDEINPSSSRGRSVEGVQKPEVSAPGTDIISAGIAASNSYRIMTGTSQAGKFEISLYYSQITTTILLLVQSLKSICFFPAPHVVGAVALMKSVNPTLTEDQARTLLQNTAARPPVALSDLACDRPANGAEYPNAAFGFGRINVAAAMGIQG